MLIIANGAFKSGSTWLRNIVVEMMSFEPVPRKYQHPDLSHWIYDQQLPTFLRHIDCRSRNYITKSHILDTQLRELLLGHEDVRVLGIKRNIRDVLVSHYYHMARLGQFGASKDFRHYYWSVGRYKAYHLRAYNHIWDKQSPHLYTTRFEQLKGDFEGEVTRLGAFLGVALDKKDIEYLEHTTSLEVQRKLRGEGNKESDKRFFRKGIIGEWRNHFDEPMISDVQSIYENGLSGLSLLKYHALFTSRQGFNRAVLRLRYQIR